MKTTIGSPARKDQFFKRDILRNEIIEALLSGENLLLSAPRRVGKTSLLYNLIDEQSSDVFPVYINTEAIEDHEVFFQKLLLQILNTDHIEGYGNFNKQTKEFLKKWGNKISGFNILGVGVQMRPEEKVNYYDQLIQFLSELEQNGPRLVVLVDEFPITVEHIHRKHGLDGVKLFLDQNRSLRQTPGFTDKIKFVYCGSIGLFSVVKKLQATDRINDLREIKMEPLRKKEAIQFVTELLKTKTGLVPDEETMSYILGKIEWWIPFYFQLLIKELAELIKYDDALLNQAAIDKAFDRVVENGNIYFEHFKSRLNKAFESPELKFVLDFMLRLKNKNRLTLTETIDLSEAHGMRTKVDEIIEVLTYDGYITTHEGEYQFYSPILKKWWK